MHGENTNETERPMQGALPITFTTMLYFNK